MPKYLFVNKRELSHGKTFDLDYAESSIMNQVEKKGGMVQRGTFKYSLTPTDVIFSIEFYKDKPQSEGEPSAEKMNEIVFGRTDKPTRF